MTLQGVAFNALHCEIPSLLSFTNLLDLTTHNHSNSTVFFKKFISFASNTFEKMGLRNFLLFSQETRRATYECR